MENSNLLNELVRYVSSGRISEQTLDLFLAPFRDEKTITETTAPVTKFLQYYNFEYVKRLRLETFFETRQSPSGGLWAEFTDFRQMLKEVASYSHDVTDFKIGLFTHEVLKTSLDETIDEAVGDRILNASVAEDLAEARKRIYLLATFIDTQSSGKPGILKNDGTSTIVFRYRLLSGDVISVYTYWSKEYNRWYCKTWKPETVEKGSVRFSYHSA